MLDDPWAGAERTNQISRVVFCSGKVYYDLLEGAEKMKTGRPALIRLEQLYTFPWEEVRAILKRYPRIESLVWAQEEPKNMGAWRYLEPKLQELLPTGARLEYVGRPERASPAEGYPAAHAAEQSRIVREALEARSKEAPVRTTAKAGEGQG